MKIDQLGFPDDCSLLAHLNDNDKKRILIVVSIIIVTIYHTNNIRFYNNESNILLKVSRNIGREG